MKGLRSDAHLRKLTLTKEHIERVLVVGCPFLEDRIMTLREFTLLALLVGGILIFATSEGQAQSCGELWYRRNSIYKAAGYCFKTARAIRTFGNAGCSYDSEYALPLSYGQRQAIDRIVRAERGLGC